MKRTLVNYGQKLDWNFMDDCQSEIFLRESTNVKNIWVPMGGVTL